MSLYEFEGIDGSGKTTLAKAVAKEIGAKVISFPNYDSPTGRLIKAHLCKQWSCMWDPSVHGPDENLGTSAMVFQALNIANRMELMRHFGVAYHSHTDHIVLVRYWRSGVVYGQMDGLDKGWLLDAHESMVRAHR